MEVEALPLCYVDTSSDCDRGECWHEEEHYRNQFLDELSPHLRPKPLENSAHHEAHKQVHSSPSASSKYVHVVEEEQASAPHSRDQSHDRNEQCQDGARAHYSSSLRHASG